MRALITHLRRQAIAYLALFVALSGVAYAATKAPKNSVVSKSIKANNVKTSDLANSAVTEEKLKDGAVTEPKLDVDFVPGQNVQRLFMDQVQCGSVSTPECDTAIGGRLPGGVIVRAACLNDAVDANGGRLGIAVADAEEVEGYMIQAFTNPVSASGDTPLDVTPGNNDFEEGTLHFTAQAADGTVATVDLRWSISTFPNGTALCDIEGTALSAGP